MLKTFLLWENCTCCFIPSPATLPTSFNTIWCWWVSLFSSKCHRFYSICASNIIDKNYYQFRSLKGQRPCLFLYCNLSCRNSEYTTLSYATFEHGLFWAEGNWESTDPERSLLRTSLLWLKTETSEKWGLPEILSLREFYGHEEDGESTLRRVITKNRAKSKMKTHKTKSLLK